MNERMFTTSDVLAILGFGFSSLQVAQNFDEKNLRYWIAIFILVLVIIVFAIYSYRMNRKLENSFSVIKAKRGYEGDEFLRSLRNAERMVRVIHTVTIPPSNQVTEELLFCLERGVEVIRIIPEKLMEIAEINAWLNKFPINNGSNYRLHIIQGDRFRMPFSFLIVDDMEVFAYFPDSTGTDTTTEILHFKNREVAKMFRNVFQKLHLQAELEKKHHE